MHTYHGILNVCLFTVAGFGVCSGAVSEVLAAPLGARISDSDVADVRGAIDALLGDDGTCSLAVLLVALCERCRPSTVVGGLIVQVARHVEAALCKKAVGAKEMGPTPWWDKDSSLCFTDAVLSTSYRERASRLKAYSTAALTALRSPAFLTVVADDSRVGRRAIKLVAAVLPSNHAWWLAPQVVCFCFYKLRL